MLGQISSLGHKVDITIVLHNQGDGCFLEATAYSEIKGHYTFGEEQDIL